MLWERGIYCTASAGADYIPNASIPGPDNPSVITNNTYKALRLIGEDYNLYYSVWCGGEHQLYDLHVRAQLPCPFATDDVLI